MTTTNPVKPFYYSSLVLILVLCLGLFLLDKDNHLFTDLLKKSNLFALPLYVIPTYLTCAALYYYFERKKNKHSSILALTIGVPLGITLVIIVLSASIGRL